LAAPVFVFQKLALHRHSALKKTQSLHRWVSAVYLGELRQRSYGMDPIEKTSKPSATINPTGAELNTELVVEQIEDALDRNDVGAAVNTLEALEDTDKIEVFDELDLDDQAELLPQLNPETSAEILAELHEEDQAEIARRVDDETLGDILDEMEPDDAADVIGDLSQERQARVLAEMEVDAADDVRALLIHPDDTAGGLMTNSFLALRPNMTAQQAIDALREWGPDNETAYYLFVVGRDRQLVGVVSLRYLITAPPNKLVQDIMAVNVVSVPVGTDQEACANVLRKYGFQALPVVDAEHRLLGVITADDLVEVIEEEAAEDAFRLSGVTDEERVFSPLSVSMKKRMPWLVVNLGTAFLSAWVYGLFTGTIDSLPFLAALPGIVAGQGGNAATQRITILVRGLGTGEAEVKDAGPIILKEMLIGLLQGLALALCVGTGVALWQHNAVLGLVIGLAMVGNLVVAGLAGTAIPFLLKLVRLDPALASAVIVTTFTDSCGFAFSLGLATLLIQYLRP
jgi:magnesium transporter